MSLNWPKCIRRGSHAVEKKYGDADLASKRRKQEVLGQTTTNLQCTQIIEDTEDEEDDCAAAAVAVAEADADYLCFQTDAASNPMHHSSICDLATADSIGSLTNQSASNKNTFNDSNSHNYKSLEIVSATVETSAKEDLFITENSAQTSKGFENTFKLLQKQLEHRNEKSKHRLLSATASTSSLQSNASFTTAASFGCDEESNRFDLELESLYRMRLSLQCLRQHLKQNQQQTHCAAAANSSCAIFITLLYDFAVKNLSKHVLTAQELELAELVHEIVDAHPDLLYHAARGPNGKNTIKIIPQQSNKSSEVLCGNRVSQMTRAYDDIEAVTRLLEEKEKDLELTVQIGKELLTQNSTLEHRIAELTNDLKSSNDDRAQLVHELHKKNELIAVLTNDVDDGSEAETPTLSKSITLDLLQKKITTLQDENKSLKMEACQLADQTECVEAHERQLMEDITSQLNEANSQFDGISLELERQREENRLQHEQIVNLTERLAEAEMRLHKLTHDNEEHLTLLSITKENQNSLALELVEFKQRYQEVLALLQEAQEQLRKQRKKTMPQARSSFMSSMLQPDSLHSELMESSMYSENSIDSGISGDSQRVNDRIGRLMTQLPGMSAGVAGAGLIGASGAVPPYKKVFETVRCASKFGNYMDSSCSMSMSQLGAMSMSSASGPRMSATTTHHPAGSYYRGSGYDAAPSMAGKTLSCESLASQSEDSYPVQATGVPGAPGAKDLEAALKRLTPAEVLARRAMLSYAPAGTYNYDEPPTAAALPLGIRTPDSIMSTGSSGISSTTNMSASLNHWRLPEKLQIVKPMEGSQTLHHWSRLATPTLSGLLDERPGVKIRGGRELEDLGMQVYTLSDVEEDASDDLPGKQFEASGCTYTYTMSHVMHPDDGLVNDLSFLSQSQMSSRLASATTSRQPSCPATPRAGLSRKNSCSTFSVNLGLASMLNERGIKAVTPSALNTPAGPNFSPTVTPCNSPEGSPTRARSPEPLFGLLSSGADLIKRKLIGDLERPTRNQQQQRQQKIMLSRLERRALRSLRLVEKVESIGLENIIATQTNPMSQLASGIASRSQSPMAQLTSLKNLHTSANQMVDDIHFDRDQIKDVLNKGLKSPSTLSEASSYSAASSSSKVSEKAAAVETAAQQKPAAVDKTSKHATADNAATETRVKQMQRQKSRRNLKNGMAAQRTDLGTIGGGGGNGGARMRSDLGKVAAPKQQLIEAGDASSLHEKAATAPKETQSIAQAFVGSVSSLLFGRKGGWL